MQKFLTVLLLLGLGITIAGCPKVSLKAPLPKAIIPAGPLFQIQVSPGSPRTTVGGTVVLTARGVDKEGREVEVNPTWKCDPEGKVEPTAGKTVTFTALKTGVCYIEVSQGDIKATIAVEIK